MVAHDVSPIHAAVFEKHGGPIILLVELRLIWPRLGTSAAWSATGTAYAFAGPRQNGAVLDTGMFFIARLPRMGAALCSWEQYTSRLNAINARPVHTQATRDFDLADPFQEPILCRPVWFSQNSIIMRQNRCRPRRVKVPPGQAGAAAVGAAQGLGADHATVGDDADTSGLESAALDPIRYVRVKSNNAITLV